MPIFKDFAENGELLQIRFEQLNRDNLARYVKVTGYDAACGYLDALEDTTGVIKRTFEIDYGEGLIFSENIHYIGKKNVVDDAKRVSFLDSAKEIIEKHESRWEAELSSSKQSKNSDDLLKFISYVETYGFLRSKGYVEGVEDISKEIRSYFCRTSKDDKPEKSTMAYIGSQMQKLQRNRIEFVNFARPLLSSFKI